MKKLFEIFLLMSLSNIQYSLVNAQNLVPNPSFEQHSNCPNNGDQINFTNSWSNPTIYASPDYFNSCSPINYGVPNNLIGIEPAINGVAYAGIITYGYNTMCPSCLVDYREYIQVQLTNPLQAGENYCVKFHVSLADSSQYAVNNIGAYFSSSLISQANDSVILVSPQINNDPVLNPLTNKVGWTMVLDSFVAVGGENYMIIGNFNTDATTNQLSVTGADWTYYGFYYIDDIWVGICDSLVSIDEHEASAPIQIFPNPAQNFISIHSKEKYTQIEVYNSIGKLINHIDEFSDARINIQDLPMGIYILKIKFDQSEINQKLIKN